MNMSLPTRVVCPKCRESYVLGLNHSCQKTGRTEHFAFDLGGKVMIKEIQRPGRIIALAIDYTGVNYRVQFWNNSEYRSEWLSADELEAR